MSLQQEENTFWRKTGYSSNVCVVLKKILFFRTRTSDTQRRKDKVPEGSPSMTPLNRSGRTASRRVDPRSTDSQTGVWHRDASDASCCRRGCVCSSAAGEETPISDAFVLICIYLQQSFGIPEALSKCCLLQTRPKKIFAVPFMWYMIRAEI